MTVALVVLAVGLVYLTVGGAIGARRSWRSMSSAEFHPWLERRRMADRFTLVVVLWPLLLLRRGRSGHPST